MPRKQNKQPDNFEDAAETLVSRLYDEIIEEGCVAFVGAGCTTERRYSRSEPSFYEEIRRKAGLSSDGDPLSFPELMEYFCKNLDGGRHNRLIREAVARIERFAVTGEDNRYASMFGNELAEIPYFSRYVTTNWDPFLERSLEVMIPIVEDRDIAFWDDRKRQVLKVHGCITRPYSLVATLSDYEACLKRNPLIFNKLKDLMATKTFLFVGYSLRDSDFQQVWDGIVKSLGRFTKLAYAIDPSASPDSVSHWQQRGIQLFKTSDLLFVRTLRKRLEKEDLVPAERFLNFLHRERRRIVSIHVRLSQDSSGGLASAMYQDGLLHGLERVLTATALGTKRREAFETDLAEASRAVREMEEKVDPIEVAYWTGRAEVLHRFLSRNSASIPAFIHPYRLIPSPKLVKGDRI
jgi:hypothetical protein